MKKFLIALIMVAPLFGVVSCGPSNSKAEKIYEKYCDDEKLSDSENEFCIEYIIAAKKYEMSLKKDCDNKKELKRVGKKVSIKFPYLSEMNEAVDKDKVSNKLLDQLDEVNDELKESVKEAGKAIDNAMEEMGKFSRQYDSDDDW